MSKIGKKKILIPKEVNVSVSGDDIDIKGPYGNKKINLDTKLFEVNIRENKELSIFKRNMSVIQILKSLKYQNQTKTYTNLF